MSKKNSLAEAPYREVGRYEVNTWVPRGWELMSFPQGKFEWRPNKPFQAELSLLGAGRGRSSTVFNWVDDSTGIEYPMFVSSLSDLLENTCVTSGKTEKLTWIVVKRGMNYGIERFQG